MVVAVLLGSVRPARMSERVSKWVSSELKKAGHEVVIVDPAKLELPLLQKMWKEVKDSDAAEDAALKAKLKPLADLYARVDGFCVVSAEYNHTAPPALVNLIDYFLQEYFFKPSAIVCYSTTPFGGVRGAMGLRSLLAEVGMPTIPSLQPVASVGASLSEEGVALTQELAEKSGKFFKEFDWYMRAFKAERALGVPY